jgi:hypothetical protein
VSSTAENAENSRALSACGVWSSDDDDVQAIRTLSHSIGGGGGANGDDDDDDDDDESSQSSLGAYSSDSDISSSVSINSSSSMSSERIKDVLSPKHQIRKYVRHHT